MRATFAIAALLLAGCAADRAAPSVPKGGDGTLRLSLPGHPATLNPDLAPYDEMAGVVGDNLFSHLVTLGEDGSISPDLADRWEQSTDGRVYTFHLNKDARFHDRRRVTSADVRATLSRLRDSPNHELADRLAAVETPDAETVVVKLNAPWAAFLPAMGGLGTYILPADALTSRTPAGSGPFELRSWQPGKTIVLEKNPDYFRQGPYVDELDYVFASGHAAAELLVSGKTDVMIGRPPAADIPALMAAPGVRVTTAPSDGRAYLGFNMRRPPFNDIRMRRAVNLALDRGAIVERVLNGYGAPASGFFTPALGWAYNPAARVPAYDPAEARRLVTAAMPHDRTIVLRIWRGSPTLATLAGEISRQLREIGLIVRTREVSITDSLAIGADADFDMTVLSGSEGPDPDSLSARVRSDGSMQVMGYDDPEVDAALDAGARSTDVAARARAYFRVQELLAKDLPIAPLYETVRVTAYRAGLRGLPTEDARGLVPGFAYNLVRMPGHIDATDFEASPR